MNINYIKLENWYLRSLSGGSFCLEKRILKNRFYQLFLDGYDIKPPINSNDKSLLLIVNNNDVPLKKYPILKGTVTEILKEVKCYE